jgi:hypothetical protein
MNYMLKARVLPVLVGLKPVLKQNVFRQLSTATAVNFQNVSVSRFNDKVMGYLGGLKTNQISDHYLKLKEFGMTEAQVRQIADDIQLLLAISEQFEGMKAKDTTFGLPIYGILKSLALTTALKRNDRGRPMNSIDTCYRMPMDLSLMVDDNGNRISDIQCIKRIAKALHSSRNNDYDPLTGPFHPFERGSYYPSDVAAPMINILGVQSAFTASKLFVSELAHGKESPYHDEPMLSITGSGTITTTAWHTAMDSVKLAVDNNVPVHWVIAITSNGMRLRTEQSTKSVIEALEKNTNIGAVLIVDETSFVDAVAKRKEAEALTKKLGLPVVLVFQVVKNDQRIGGHGYEKQADRDAEEVEQANNQGAEDLALDCIANMLGPDLFNAEERLKKQESYKELAKEIFLEVSMSNKWVTENQIYYGSNPQLLTPQSNKLHFVPITDWAGTTKGEQQDTGQRLFAELFDLAFKNAQRVPFISSQEGCGVFDEFSTHARGLDGDIPKWVITGINEAHAAFLSIAASFVQVPDGSGKNYVGVHVPPHDRFTDVAEQAYYFASQRYWDSGCDINERPDVVFLRYAFEKGGFAGDIHNRARFISRPGETVGVAPNISAVYPVLESLIRNKGVNHLYFPHADLVKGFKSSSYLMKTAVNPGDVWASHNGVGTFKDTTTNIITIGPTAVESAKALQSFNRPAGLFVLPFVPTDGASIHGISASLKSLNYLETVKVIDPFDGGTALSNYAHLLRKEFPNVDITFESRMNAFFAGATTSSLIRKDAITNILNN